MKITSRMLLFIYTLLFMLPQHLAASETLTHWVGTWATAPQLVESHNNPPSPGLKGNELRQIFQISIGGDTARLKLSNEFSTSATEIVSVEMAYALTAGSQSTIDESSRVLLTFDGNTSITIAAGQKVTSDPIAFHLDARQNVAVTIKYGEASSTSVTGHPGSRTTSYLKSASTSSFAQATKTEHWYSILSLEVKAPVSSGCVAILGNSITDGRGSTTNQQNRWPDVLSRRLLPSGLGADDNYSSDDNPDNPNIDENTFSSNLPLIYIHTSATINADQKVAGTMKIIDNPEGRRNYENDTLYNYNGPIGIKLRGNSSLSFAQKKYTLETWDEEGNDVKKSLLGLPAESDWVLLAPYNDLSLVRDVFAYNMWTEMGHWGPRTRMCEVFINNEYLGIYVFCEKIKRDKNRVDIANLKTEDIADRELTGGYIVRVDAFDENDVTFKSKVNGLQTSMWGGMGSGTVTWTIFYPKKEDLQEEQKKYIQNYVDQMEQSFQQTNFKDSVEGYAKWINVPSFVDYFIHTELSLNADGYKRSSYFFKDKDANDGTVRRMEAGPVWDYNLAYGDCNFCNANNPQAWVYEGCDTNPTPALWKKLTQDPAFMAKVRARYAELRRTIISSQNINAFFDDYAEMLDEAKDRHYEKYDDLFQSGNSGGWWGGWGGTTSPISYFAAYYVESYEEEIQTVKEWFAKRLAFLDSQWDYDESAAIRTISDQSYFDLQIIRDDQDLTIQSDRDLQSVEVYSLSGHLLQSVSAVSLGSHLTVPLRRSLHSQPVIVICQATDDSYISRKVR